MKEKTIGNERFNAYRIEEIDLEEYKFSDMYIRIFRQYGLKNVEK